MASEFGIRLQILFMKLAPTQLESLGKQGSSLSYEIILNYLTRDQSWSTPFLSGERVTMKSPLIP